MQQFCSSYPKIQSKGSRLLLCPMEVHLQLCVGLSTGTDENGCTSRTNCPRQYKCHDVNCSGKYQEYFKCPGYYCVPRRYICNSVWDCPHGADEANCTFRTNCPGQYKCYDSVICIAMQSICDEVDDCKYKDDEYFCDYGMDSPFPFPKCPNECRCLLFSITCITDHSNKTIPVKQSYPLYKIIFLSNYKGESIGSIFKQFPVAIAFSLKLETLTKVCINTLKAGEISHIHILDASHNNIERLESYCFKDMGLLRFLNISCNKLQKIPKFTFSNISRLEILDMSFNQIFALEEKCFYGSNNLSSLNLAGNDLLVINLFSLDGIPDNINISTDNYGICCLKRTGCLPATSTTNQCRFTLLSSVASAFMITISTVGMVLSLLVIILNVLNTGDLGGHNYRSTVIALALSDLCCSTSILTIGVSNVAYGKSYFEQGYYWKYHFLCFNSAALIIVESVTSCLVINILAISRLQVIRSPFDSKFLEHVDYRFVAKLLIGTAFCSFLFSLTIMITYWLSSGQFHTGLCVMFGNVKDSVYPLSITIIIILINFLSMFSVPVFYFAIYRILRESENTSAGSQKQKAKSALKQFSLSFISPIYWLSSNIILITILILDQPSSDLLMWFVTLILPLKTLIHPFIFTFKTVFMSMVKHSHLFVILKLRGPKNVDNNHFGQSRASVRTTVSVT